MCRQDHCLGYSVAAFDSQRLQGALGARSRHADDERRLLYLDAQDDAYGPSAFLDPDHEVANVPRGYLFGDGDRV